MSNSGGKQMSAAVGATVFNAEGLHHQRYLPELDRGKPEPMTRYVTSGVPGRDSKVFAA
jgi:hypothetical protein